MSLVLRFVLSKYPYLIKHRPPFLPREEAGDLLAEARRLNRAGYCVAAVVTSRIAVERAIRSIALKHPAWERRNGRSGMRDYVRFLYRVNLLNRACNRAIHRFSRRANAVTHGHTTDRWRARNIIQRAASVVAMLEGGAA